MRERNVGKEFYVIMGSYSVDIANAIKEFLVSDDWNFSFDDKLGVFQFRASLRGRIKDVRYLIIVRDGGYTVHVSSPVGADQDDDEMMAKMAEFICRANCGLRMGNFELDYNDGEISYKVYIECAGGTVPAREAVIASILVPANMFEKYGAGITEMIFGSATAKDAVAKCEIDS